MELLPTMASTENTKAQSPTSWKHQKCEEKEEEEEENKTWTVPCKWWEVYGLRSLNQPNQHIFGSGNAE